MSRTGWWPAAVALALVLAAPAAADPDRGAFPLEDRLQLIVLSHSVIAIDGRTGGQREQSLELGEQVQLTRSDGRVGIAVTDRRILAIATGSGAFQQARFVRGEAFVGRPQLGDRVALFVTTRRVVGFDGGSGNLVEVRLGPRAARPAGVEARIDSEVFKTIEALTEKHYGVPTLPTMSTGATDMAFLRAKGVQCYGVGPGIDMENGPKGFGAHSDQERILESELHRFVRFQYDVVTALAAAK